MNNQWFQSSTGSGDLALTIKGLLVALVPLTVAAMQRFNVHLAQDQVSAVIDAGFAAVAAVMVLVGLIRKIANRV